MNFDRQIKHEWYQTNTVVVISLLVKNVDSSLLNVIFNENSVEVIYTKENEQFQTKFDLFSEVIPNESSYKVFSTKIEIKLIKNDGSNWSNLVKTAKDSKAQNKNWDKIMNDMSGEIEEDGDPLNSLFQKIYKDGNDETRKAMVKSFTESNGTVLSTNWSDVKAKHVETKPPDGMELKKYDY